MDTIDTIGDTIARNWAATQERVRRAAEIAGRDPRDIEVVAVTKTRTTSEMDEAILCGASAVGENRIQEADAKKPHVHGQATWHLVGHLQSNKAARAVALFDLVQSVDSARLAGALSRHAGIADRVLDILVQVNTSEAPGQSGVNMDTLMPMLEEIATLEHVRVRGLMSIGAHSQDERLVRSGFSTLRTASERIGRAGIPNVEMRYLSMGMSGDFEWAIAEGANMLRLGSCLFGPRT